MDFNDFFQSLKIICCRSYETKSKNDLDHFIAMAKKVCKWKRKPSSRNRKKDITLTACQRYFTIFFFSTTSNLLRETRIATSRSVRNGFDASFQSSGPGQYGNRHHFYPLGSCTMKLNPRINEWAANLPGFTRTHPLAPDDTVQGNLQIFSELLNSCVFLCGMTAGTLLPNAGAQENSQVF